MALFPPSRDEVVLATICGVWAGFFFAGEGPAALLTVPLVALAVLPYRRRPVAAAFAVAGVSVLHNWFLAVPLENPGPLAALFVVVYALGRYLTPVRALVPLTVHLAVAVAPDPALPTVVFVFVLLGSVWAFGYIVQRRTGDARRAAAAAAELAALDPAARAEQVVAEERARLAGDAVAVVRGAVLTMQWRAADAVAHLDPLPLAAIQDEGRRATNELRRLLGLLRDVPEPDAPSGPGRPSRSVWLTDLLTTAGVGAFAALEVSLAPHSGGAPAVPLALLLVASLALRRVDPVLACVTAILAPAVALAFGSPLPPGLWMAVVGALLAWSVTSRGRLLGYAALGVFSGVLLLAIHKHDPGNEAMMVAVAALAGIAGHLWAARDREERSASATAARLRAEHEAVAEQAVRAERLRLARELHDVTSHAVGVMVLQAGAAQALRATDPDRAREAVGVVRITAKEALRELDALAGLLDAGAVGPIPAAGPQADGDLTAALAGLVERIRSAGLHVGMRVTGPLPSDPQVATTVYRVVQEALTNAVRYAPGSRVDIDIQAGDAALKVAIRDDGRPCAAPGEGGFGLVGLAERVRGLGGEFSAGPQPAGGFAVRATLPLHDQVEARS